MISREKTNRLNYFTNINLQRIEYLQKWTLWLFLFRKNKQINWGKS
jgi:hypothetical protein